MHGPTPDIFDEPNYVLVVAEIDGLTRDDVHLELHDDILTLVAEQGDVKFRSEILLPGIFTADRMSYACRNGVLEIRLAKS